MVWLIFVHWKKGTPTWTKISPYIFFLVLIMNYIIVPGLNIVLSIYLFISPSYTLTEQTSESFVVFFFTVCLMRVIEYFTLVRRSVVLDARIFLENKATLDSLTREELEDLKASISQENDF